MSKRTTFAVLAGLLAATLLPAGCRDSVSPARRGPTAPQFDAAAASGIVLDQFNGIFNENGKVIIKGFDPTNPQLGDAIIATFVWLGSTNIIDSVTDVLTTSPFTPVGNTYTLVEYVTADGISMATYVATNVQNFPPPNTSDTRKLAGRAALSEPVAEGGMLISAWTGVDAVFAQAVGRSSSASGAGSTSTVADPGAIDVGAGALVYGITSANALVTRDPPAGFTTLAVQSDGQLVDRADYTVQASAGAVDPQWTWHFEQHPGTWLATVLALNPPPPPATHLAFTIQPSNTTAGSTISPAVQVAAQDDAGNTVVGFGADITIALGNNPGGGMLSGTKTVTPVNGVATFSTLSINNPGTGYTLVATTTASGVTGATSAAFNITPRPATHLVFTVQPTTTTAGSPISPAVQVAAQDDAGNTVAGFGTDITIALGNNPGGGMLSGTKTVTPVNGVATFSTLSINNPGTGYTLVATTTAPGVTGATSAAFNITPLPQQVRVQLTGGGRIDPAIGKTTFGFDVDGRSGPPF